MQSGLASERTCNYRDSTHVLRSVVPLNLIITMLWQLILCVLRLPYRVLRLPCCVLRLPCRGLRLPCRVLMLPCCVLMLPCRYETSPYMSPMFEFLCHPFSFSLFLFRRKISKSSFNTKTDNIYVIMPSICIYKR